MESKYKLGDTVYLRGNNHFIEKSTVVMTVAGFFLFRFTKWIGGTRVRESRLYPIREEAETIIIYKI